MKKLLAVLVISLFMMGCATMGRGPSSDVEEMKKDVAELKAEIKRMKLMGAAGMVAADFQLVVR